MARPEYTALLSHWPGASPGGVVKAPDGGCQSGILLDAGQCASLDGGLFHEPRDQAVNTAGGAWEGGWLALEEDFGLLLEWAKSFRFRPKAFLCRVLWPGAYLPLRACGGIQPPNEKSEALGPGWTCHGHHIWGQSNLFCSFLFIHLYGFFSF